MKPNFLLYCILLSCIIFTAACANEISQEDSSPQPEIEWVEAESVSIEITKTVQELGSLSVEVDEFDEFVGEVFPVIQFERTSSAFGAEDLPDKFDFLNNGELVLEDGTVIDRESPEIADSLNRLFNTYIRFEEMHSFYEGEEHEIDHDAIIKVFEPASQKYIIVLIVEGEELSHGLATMVVELQFLLIGVELP
ncbi:MAG: hypothetical protein AAF490_17990 [Chloroflexota bacterium]